MRTLVRASVALALTTCFAIPASAHAATAARTASCGHDQADFVGSYRIADIADVVYIFNRDRNLTVYYYDQPAATGSFAAGNGVISWTINGNTTTSTSITCGSTSSVATIEGTESDGYTISLVRA